MVNTTLSLKKLIVQKVKNFIKKTKKHKQNNRKKMKARIKFAQAKIQNMDMRIVFVVAFIATITIFSAIYGIK